MSGRSLHSSYEWTTQQFHYGPFGDPHGPILKSKEDHYFQFMEDTFAIAASFKSAGVRKFRLSHRTQANDWFQLGSSEQTRGVSPHEHLI